MPEQARPRGSVPADERPGLGCLAVHRIAGGRSVAVAGSGFGAPSAASPARSSSACWRGPRCCGPALRDRSERPRCSATMVEHRAAAARRDRERRRGPGPGRAGRARRALRLHRHQQAWRKAVLAPSRRDKRQRPRPASRPARCPTPTTSRNEIRARMDRARERDAASRCSPTSSWPSRLESAGGLRLACLDRPARRPRAGVGRRAPALSRSEPGGHLDVALHGVEATGRGDAGGVDTVVGVDRGRRPRGSTSLGLGAARAHDHPGALGEHEAQAVGRRQGIAAQATGRRSARRPGHPGWSGACSRSRSMVGGDLGEVVDPHRELVGRVQAVLGRDVVEQVAEAATLGLGRGGHLADAAAAPRRRPCPSRGRDRRSSRAPPRSRTPAPGRG